MIAKVSEPANQKKRNGVFDFLSGFVLSVIITIKEGLWQKA
jgi:hypothetical protein